MLATDQRFKETGVNISAWVCGTSRPRETYMFLDLEPGSSLGEEGAVHGGECVAGKAKISLFFIIGQRSISKSFLYGLSGTMTVTVWESIRGHENLSRGSWEMLILSVDHESWKKSEHFVLASYQPKKDSDGFMTSPLRRSRSGLGPLAVVWWSVRETSHLLSSYPAVRRGVARKRRFCCYCCSSVLERDPWAGEAGEWI